MRSGLYLITPSHWEADALLDCVDALLTLDIATLQYRAKPAPELAVAQELAQMCRAQGTAFVINDDLTVARKVGAGLHLGRDDASIGVARSQLGESAMIGASCYADPQLAEHAIGQGANYVAFGSFFASPTKPAASRVPPDLVRMFTTDHQVPVVGIGGLTPDNVAVAIAAGCTQAAVCSGVFQAADPTATAQAIIDQFPKIPASKSP